MRRAALLLAALLLPPGGRALASGADPASAPAVQPVPSASPPAAAAPLGPLADPGAYSLAPAAPTILPPLVAGGVASTSFGSNGYHAGSLELDSGLIGGSTRAFVAVGAGQGPRWRDAPQVDGRSFSAGLSTALPFGTTLSVSAGVQQDRLTHPW